MLTLMRIELMKKHHYILLNKQAWIATHELQKISMLTL
jgi:hypothetical protein